MLQISTLEFDASGTYLAVGYSNGSVAIMVKSNQNQRSLLGSSGGSLLQHSSSSENTPISLSSSTSSGSLKRHDISGSNESMNRKRILRRRSNASDNIMLIDEHYNTSTNNEPAGLNNYNDTDDSSTDDMFIMDDNISISTSSSSILGLNTGVNDSDMVEQEIYIHQQLQSQLQLCNQPSFDILFYFQAHESEVIQIRWCDKMVCSQLLFLSTSVSSSKLWRFAHYDTTSPTIQQLPLRIINNHNNQYKFSLKKSYEHEEIFNLNSLSINSDCQTFISSDEFRVYLWDLNIGQQCYNIIDLKPSNMQLLTEIIRVTEFHPTQCNSLIYGTSNGTVKLCDLRISALCNSNSKTFESKQNSPSIFSQYLNSILDLKFNKDGRYFVTRNLESLIIWDINMENQPLATYNLYNQEYLLAKLYDMYDSSTFVEKFPCTFINNEIITGSYDNRSLVWNPFTSDSFIFEAAPYQSMLFDEQLADNSRQVYSFTSPIVNDYYNNPFLVQSPPSPLMLAEQSQQPQQQQPVSQASTSAHPSSPMPSPPIPSSTSGYLFDPVQIDLYNQFNHIPVRNWSAIKSNYSKNSPFVNRNNNQSQTPSSLMSADKLTIKDHLNSMINCISHANGSTALSNKNQLFIYSSTT